jgi:DNA (cytosine-5)-methyltransferase 1
MGTGGGQVNAVLYDRQKQGVYGENECSSTLTAHEAKEGNDIVCQTFKGDVCGTPDAHYAQCPGARGGVERDVVRVKEDDFNAAGTQSQILRLLCKTYGAQAVVEWGIAVVAALQQTEVLRQGLHEESNACKAENRNKLDDSSLPCPSVVADWMLRDMREKSECGCSPQRQQSAEQRDQQSATAVQVLSLESTQRCKEMFDMWKKGQGIGILRQTLSEIQEIWQSACCEKERCRYIVRRLTPLEAERLQGYPDGWTDIGEWTDTKCKKHKAADSPRYKALGNSIAIPPWLWVLSRLNEYCEEKTMASLFDGIGGFPLIWEFLNGTSSAVWCSEIEEFPIAVTKVRFPE